MPRERTVPSTAATWPWGRDRRMATAASSDGNVTPPSRAGGIFERFATVLLRMRFCSRHASRRRMAGGEDRFGMTSTLRATARVLTWQHKSNASPCVRAERPSLFRGLRDAVGRSSTEWSVWQSGGTGHMQSEQDDVRMIHYQSPPEFRGAVNCPDRTDTDRRIDLQECCGSGFRRAIHATETRLAPW